MNILQLCNKMPYPPKDGGAIAIINLTRAFNELGHKIVVLAMNTSKHYFDVNDLPPDIKQIANFNTVFVDNTLKPLKALTALLNNQSYHVKRFITVPFEQKLKELLKNHQFDIIQLEGMYLAPYIDVIRKYSKAKIVMRAHNVEYLIWERICNQEKNRLKKKYLQLLARQLRKFELKQLANYDLLVPITAIDAAIFKKHGYNKPLHVCPASYNSAAIANYNAREMEFPSLFFIGSLDWLPNLEGIDWFIEYVWDKLSALLPELKFYIAGRNMPKRFFELKKKNIVFVGEVPDAYEFMNKYAIMLAPLFSGSGMRVKIIEGMAMGKTIVTTTIGAEGINCENNNTILIADNAVDFVNVIVDIVNNKTKFNAIGANAKKNALANYSALATAEKLIEFYRLNLQ